MAFLPTLTKSPNGTIRKPRRLYKGGVKDWKLATFNAKDEELTKKPTYKSALAKRRCLIPADAWYEFKGAKASKSKFELKPRDEDWFCFAGLWDRADICRTVARHIGQLRRKMRPAVRHFSKKELVNVRGVCA
jgi:hypothetical protein